ASTPAPAPPPDPVTPEVLSQPEVVTATTPVLDSTSISEVVTSVNIPSALEIPPLNYGDLAALGFSNWTPVGFAQWSMELIQVSSGMSWLWTIATVTILSRLIIFPFHISAIRTTAKLTPYQPRLLQLRDEFRKVGNLTKDPIAVQKISLQQKKIYEEADVSLLTPFLNPLVQLPISLGLFFGIKRLCELPLEQLKVGGFGWITDLTVPDPMYALPLAMAALVNVQLSVGARDVTSDAAETHHLFNFLRVVSIVTVPFMASLPVGIVVYVVTNVVCMMAQSVILRVPSVRKALDIPKIPDHMYAAKPPTFLETAKFGVDWFKNKVTEAQ
ncbi:hypothetical protein BDM02DRAFT_3084167, partial [Thelephora ganbajun]